ncbi:next to BRCA1 gene 1 protein isoform X2 [Clupea harengus]|uniref:Next to BRCA1 gene 1 protein isoform X2 n=1 Tax=Clupea harengus TaxID=7950 RepID=A0A6P8EXM3_CLUHA|nr:next to BRCA1 gene 1 protein isoform X2 [Clupea harengus]
MDFYINLKVNFRGNAKNFLLSGSETKSWESMEAMVKRSFGLCNLQVTYYDDENEEVSINSQLEYEEALKSAARQGNRLQMNVYETRGPAARGPALGSSKPSSTTEPKKGFRPPQHCPALAQSTLHCPALAQSTQHCPVLAQVVSRKVQAAIPEQSMVIMKELKGTKEEDKTPPAWFTSYMEKFKDQVVREAVEKICREFSGQCCIHKPVGAEAQVPEVTSSTLPGAPSSAPACSSCRGQTPGGGYQCSHSLVRARTPLSIPEHGSPAPDHSRFYRRGDRSFRKAEKQRLKAEKRQLKAEVKEIRKQLRMERRGIQWSAAGDGSSSPVLLQPRATQVNSPERPKRPCPLAVPAMTALFLDENLPDGTRLRPGTKFIKYWKMKNTGRVCWNSDTKLKFMWGNLAVGSGDRWREVPVPALHPGQVGVVSVALCAPALEGSYTSHWRLAHASEQFGPRVWCSIVVDPLAPTAVSVDGLLVSPCVTPLQDKAARSPDKGGKGCSGPRVLMSVEQDSDREFYIPSVDLLTAQDLLSFELLDINIVQELESVPNNTPADMTPCMSPLPHEGPLQEKPSLALIQEEAEAQGVKSILDVAQAPELNLVPAQEEGEEEDISGPQFVCETVIRSLTLEEAPDRSRLCSSVPSKRMHTTGDLSTPLCLLVTDGRGDLEHCFPHVPHSSVTWKILPVVRPAVQGSASLGERRVQKVPAAVVIVTPAPSPLQTEQPKAANDQESDIESISVDPGHEEQREEREDDKKKSKEEEEIEGGKELRDTEEDKESRSRTSSASSEDYIIILPDCFDTSRPLGESMYSSALSQPGDSLESQGDAGRVTPEGEHSGAEEAAACLGISLSANVGANANDMLCTSQTLDAVPLTPVVVTAPQPCASASSENQDQRETQGLDVNELHQSEDQETLSDVVQTQPGSPSTPKTRDSETQDLSSQGITGGLVKGALSVAASAYKALFTGQHGQDPPPEDTATQDAMMAVLVEMGFGDRPLNQRLLQKHNGNLLDVVNELVQMTDNDWFSARY